MRALVIGSLCRDVDWAGRHPCPGGVVLHGGLVYRSLGARVRVVTSFRAGDGAWLCAPLAAAGIEVVARRSRATTVCANAYGRGRDRHDLRRRSDPIRLADVPEAWRRADVVHLGPLHPADVTPEVAAGVRGLRGLDVQGLLRGAATPALADHLALAAVVQVSSADAPRLLRGESLERVRRRFGIRELLLTRGRRGAVIVMAARRIVVPAQPAAGTHLAGAGDAFLAAYLLGRAQGLAPEPAGRRAAQVAALKISHGSLPPEAPVSPAPVRAAGRSRRG